MKTLTEKFGIKEGMRCTLRNVPQDLGRVLGAGSGRWATRLQGEFDRIIYFASGERSAVRALQSFKKHVKVGGTLWFCWQKGRQKTTGLSLPVVIKHAYDAEFVESQVFSVSDAWSAIKLTHPKSGKAYANSFGTLPTKVSPPGN
ncbi:MAG: hypothetical protein SFV32_04830 [Opitutaceae bacterium]|nr:hypothetical protein [Opitutaceae bacterium]